MLQYINRILIRIANKDRSFNYEEISSHNGVSFT